MNSDARHYSPAIAVLACTVAIIGVAAIWAGVAALQRSPSAWMACIAALDAGLLLRLAGWPAVRTRVYAALAVTLLTIVVAGWFVATARIGQAMGLRPAEALPLMSGDLAWLHVRSNTGLGELAWYALALLIAWRISR